VEADGSSCGTTSSASTPRDTTILLIDALLEEADAGSRTDRVPNDGEVVAQALEPRARRDLYGVASLEDSYLELVAQELCARSSPGLE
jgi:hypothetical protein